MKLKIQYIILLLSLAFYASGQPGLELRVDEMLLSFQQNMNFNGEDGSVDNKKLSQFKELFDSEAMLENVLEPENQLTNKSLSTLEFATVLLKNYPGGVKIQMDFSAGKDKAMNPIRIDKNDYLIELPVIFNIIGIYSNDDVKVIHNKREELHLYLKYRFVNNKIDKMRVFGLYQNKLRNITPYTEGKTVQYGIYINPLKSKLYNREVDENPYFKLEGEYSFSAGICVKKTVFSDHMNLFAGIGFDRYASSISSYFSTVNQNVIEKTDIDGDRYYYYVDSRGMLQNYHLNFITIPIQLQYKFRKKGKNSLYTSLGTGFSFLIDYWLWLEGSVETSGYYPEYHVVLSDIPEYNFETVDYENDLDWEPSKLNIDIRFSLGYEMALSESKRKSLQIGLFTKIGLSDLGFEESLYTGDFIDVYEESGVLRTMMTGLEMRFFFK